MPSITRLLALLMASLSLISCSGFRPTVDHGVPNLANVAPRLWRMGQPANPAAWDYLASRIGDAGGRVLVVKLNDASEGDDSPALAYVGWRLLVATIPPEDDKPWTVLEKPDPAIVSETVGAIASAYAAGDTVVIHCTAGRDRTGLMVGLVGMRLLGWSKSEAHDDMLAHGFRWELPDLDVYWALDVNRSRK